MSCKYILSKVKVIKNELTVRKEFFLFRNAVVVGEGYIISH